MKCVATFVKTGVAIPFSIENKVKEFAVQFIN